MDTLKLRIRHMKRIVAASIFFLLLFQATILLNSNIASAKQTTSLLLDQIVQIAQKNEQADEKLEASLKEEYIIRARSVAYVIQHIPDIEEDIEELQKIADILSVDEIHLFDTIGTIVSGTVPKYYGYSMDSGEQMAFFKPMLTDTELALCQDVTPNTAEQKPMMYAMVWNASQDGLVQVGIEPVRLLQEMKSHEMSEYIDSIPVVEGEIVHIADQMTGVICGSTESGDIGKKLSEIGYRKDESRLGTVGFEQLQGRWVLTKFVQHNGYLIGVSYDMKNVNKDLPVIMLLMFLYLMAAAFVIYHFVRKTEMANLEKQALHITSTTDALTGLHNRRAYGIDTAPLHTKGPGKNFVMASMDINNLKATNDTLGHNAGDELIQGAAHCMKAAFSPYGTIYRMGGDEFIAILTLPPEKIDTVMAQFRKELQSWHGKIVPGISIALGYVTGSEMAGSTFVEIEKAADAKMYAAKRQHYAEEGFDRRRR